MLSVQQQEEKLHFYNGVQDFFLKITLSENF